MKITRKGPLLNREFPFGSQIQIVYYPALSEIMANAGHDI